MRTLVRGRMSPMFCSPLLFACIRGSIYTAEGLVEFQKVVREITSFVNLQQREQTAKAQLP